MYHSITFQTIFVSIILVVVEDGLRETCSKSCWFNYESLNPCSCGRWSQSPGQYEYACSSKGRTMPFQSSSAMSLFPLSCSSQMKLYICLYNASAFSAHSSALTRIGSISAFSILPGIINKEINIASSFIPSSPGQG